MPPSSKFSVAHGELSKVIDTQRTLRSGSGLHPKSAPGS